MAIEAAKEMEAEALRATQKAIDALESNWRDLLTSHRAALWEGAKNDIAREKEEIGQQAHRDLEAEKDQLLRHAFDLFTQNRAAVVQHILKEYEARPRYQVWQILLGLDQGTYGPLLLAIILIVFNLLRMEVTLMVSSLRDAEERSKVTPSKREYQFVYRLHGAVFSLWIIAIVDLAYTFWAWLRTPVVLL